MARAASKASSQHIRNLFLPNTAEFVAAAGSISSIPPSMRLPEVRGAKNAHNGQYAVGEACMLTSTPPTGRANVGKSTLLNSVMQRKRLVASSRKPGRTKTLTFFRVGPKPGKLVLVDAPGYGQRGRPEWGQLFDHYLDTRQELCRVYVLLNAKHGANEADKLMLQQLDDKVQSGRSRWTLQAIVTKADLVSGQVAIDGIKRAIFENAPTCLPPIVTAYGLGADDVRRSIVEACGLAPLPR